jgi:DNA-binding HxlR family transcriptional regulator
MSAAAETTRSYAQLCGIATALDVVGDRWAALVVRDLLLGPLRFGDLADGLPGIGTNTLASRLKHLEEAGVVQRALLPLPERGTTYELTPYGRELEPVLMALGRWGAKSMGRLPADVASRSRWLAAAMLAFRDEGQRVEAPTAWELWLDDGPFTVRAAGADLNMTAGPADPADPADLVITTTDAVLHQLLTRQLSPSGTVKTGAVALKGNRSLLPRLLSLFAFPPLPDR